MRAYSIKQKNSFMGIQFQIYKKNKKVGDIIGGKFLFADQEYAIPTYDQAQDKISIFKMPSKELLGEVHKSPYNVSIMGTGEPNIIQIEHHSYLARPVGKLKLDIHVTTKESEIAMITYEQKGWFAKKDVVTFSNAINEKEDPVFIGLLIWMVIGNRASL